MTVYRSLGRNQLRKRLIERLHLFADDQMPVFVQKNIGNQVVSYFSSLVRLHTLFLSNNHVQDASVIYNITFLEQSV